MTIHVSADARDDQIDALTALCAGGSIEIRSGTQPANAAATATGTLLATLTLNSPAFDASSGGSAALDVAPAISDVAAAAGTAGWARVKDSGGATVFDGSVGTTGTDFIINSVTITLGQTVNLTGGTLSLPA